MSGESLTRLLANSLCVTYSVSLYLPTSLSLVCVRISFQYSFKFCLVDFLCKVVLAFAVAFFGQRADGHNGNGYVVLCALALTNAVAAHANEKMQPCTLSSVNALRRFCLIWCLAANAFGMAVAIANTSAGSDTTRAESAIEVLGWLWLVCGVISAAGGVLAYRYRSHQTSPQPESYSALS